MLSQASKEEKKLFSQVVSLMGNYFSENVPYATRCSEALAVRKCSSSNELFYLAFCLLCKDEALTLSDIPDNAWVFALQCRFDTLSEEMATIFVTRYSKYFPSQSLNRQKLKYLLVAILDHSFCKQLAIVREKLLISSNIESKSLSDILHPYYMEQTREHGTLALRLQLSQMTAEQHFKNIVATIFSDCELLTPLSSYPDARLDSERLMDDSEALEYAYDLDLFNEFRETGRREALKLADSFFR